MNCLGETSGAVDWSGRNLSSARIIGSDLRQANLSKIDFSNADLSGSNLTGVNLSSSNLTGARLIGTDLTGAYLSGATLTGADFSGAFLDDADLTGVAFTNVKLNSTRLEGASLVNADLSQLDLSGAVLAKATMMGAIMNRVNIAGGVLDQVDMSGADLRYADLSGGWINLATFVGANLAYANLSGASLVGTDLSGTNLSNVSLAGTTLVGANLRGADLRGADLSSADLLATEELVDKENMDDSTLSSMSESQWKKLNLSDTILDGVKYDQNTIWPEGFNIPLAAVYMPGYSAETRPDVEQLIVLTGSSVTYNLVMPLSSAFMKQQPEVFFTARQNNSTQGIQAAGNKNSNLGMSSRPMTEEEKKQYPGLEQIKIGLDSLAVVKNLSIPINSISTRQLVDILTGKIDNWSQVGGPNAPINVYVTNTDMEEGRLLGIMGDVLIGQGIVTGLPTGTAVRGAVAANKNAIGFVPARMADTSVRLIPVNGIVPTPETIRSNEYPITFPLYLVAKKQPGETIQGFIHFIASEEARQIIIQEGLEPAAP